MIKFFRKIRQNLLSEGKVGRYLTYAIGEIILVVIGILIAVNINNWNESRKERKYIQKELSALSKDLQSKLEIMTSDMQSYRFNAEYFEAVRNGSYEELDPVNFLRYLVTNATPRDYSKTYYNFKNKGGLENIPEDLSSKMNYHFEVIAQALYTSADFHRTFVSSNIESFIIANYKFEPEFQIDSISGYEMMKDEKLYSYISYQQASFNRHTNRLEEAIQSSKDLQALLDQYLNKLNEE